MPPALLQSLSAPRPTYSLLRNPDHDTTMHNRFFHVLDACVGVITTVVAALSAWLLSIADIETGADELRLLLVPLIGALIASGGMIMLNPQPETRRIVIGRSVFALLGGAASPHAAAITLKWVEPMAHHPVLLLLAGAGCSIIFYAVSRPFTAKLYSRSADIAEATLRETERRIGIHNFKDDPKP